jgi:hypothetical protein
MEERRVMKSFSTLALLAALLMFSALGCTEATDTAPDTTTPPAGTGTGADDAGTGTGDTEPGLGEE